MTNADAEDLLAVAERFTTLGRCPGGRIINHNGWVCIHCGADLTIGDPCGEPRAGFKRAAKRASKAEAR